MLSVHVNPSNIRTGAMQYAILLPYKCNITLIEYKCRQVVKYDPPGNDSNDKELHLQMIYLFTKDVTLIFN